VAQPGTGLERVAAIDVGSNSVRQLIADVASTGEIHIVDEMKEAPRLGAGVSATGRLSAHAMERATEAIVRMATLARQRGARRIEAVATSAVREARNADELVEMVARAARLELRVLDGLEEARLGFRSALAHFDLGAGRTVVADLGGGSLELALSAAGLLDRLVSLPYGALRGTERFLTPHVTRAGVKALRREVRHALRKPLPTRQWRHAQLIGSGGTFTNLAAMTLARRGLDARTVHGTRVSRAEVEHVLDTLQGMSLADRLAMPGLNPARADIIVAGIAVIAELMARLDAADALVSAYGIREGLVLQTARVTPAPANPGEARERSIRRLACSCRYDERHALQVRRLALQLFDALGARLGAAPEERDTLAAAALLHDIGYHISYDGHHKHSYYLISNAELLGMSPAERLVIANVARYHRGAAPKRKHPNLALLEKSACRQVRRLAALLRIADGLDRGHIGAVARVRVRWTDRGIRVTPVPRSARQPIRLELWGASRKTALLAKIARVPVEIVDRRGTTAAARSG
jgi:exopolyphosphatase/guanosine-5'-triphosphate,3'-diphosphate pyrophosphatase